MRFKKTLYHLFICCIIGYISCTNISVSDEVEKALQSSGSNRPELEKVLRHYSRRQKDSLKFKAACYLIVNMPGHYGEYGENEPSSPFERFAKALLSYKGAGIPQDVKEADKNAKTRSIIKYDLLTVNSSFLITNIESAFYAWENYSWCKALKFNEFKEYILPYRAANEPLIDLRSYFQHYYAWVADSLKDKTDPKEAFTLIYNDYYKQDDQPGGWEYGSIQSLEELMKKCGGNCYDQCLALSVILKSLGVPNGFESNPNWANRSKGHNWVSYVETGNLPLIIDREKSPRRHEYLHSALFDSVYPYGEFITKYDGRVKYKKAAKVFRYTYSPNKKDYCERVHQLTGNQYDFSDLFAKDLSNQYLTTQNIEIPLNKLKNKKDIFLCIFDGGNLIPVQFGILNNDKVIFELMGTDVLYIPATVENGKFVPVSNPFILEKNGNIKNILPDNRIKKEMIIRRKYPLFENILNYANLMFGARIQGSNSENFNNAVDLFYIKTTFLLPTEINITNTKEFRYFRYLPDSASTGDIAELGFFYAGKELSGQQICKYEGPVSRHFTKAFDKNYDSFYKSDIKGTWIGIDLGPGRKSKISKVKICPRTDTNYIMPGNDYELFIWTENGWISSGRMTAKDFNLKFQNIPAGGLFWLHCHSGGSEERPFTYEDGKQVWW